MFQDSGVRACVCVRVLGLTEEKKGGLGLMREESSNGLGGHAAWRAQKGYTWDMLR